MDTFTQSRVIEIIAEVLRKRSGEVSPASRFVEDLEANSLDVVELACRMEDVFHLQIPPENVVGIKTVHDFLMALKRID